MIGDMAKRNYCNKRRRDLLTPLDKNFGEVDEI